MQEEEDKSRVGTFPFNDQSMTIQTFWLVYQPKLLWPVKEIVKNLDKKEEIMHIFMLNSSQE